MLVQTEAQIFLANHRGKTLSEGFRSLHTLNFGIYNAEGREPFGSLLAFNEETLEPGKQTCIQSFKPIEIILIPTVGGLELIDSYGESIFVSPSETFRFMAFPESNFTVVNPYEDEMINYLQIHLSPDLPATATNNYIDDSPLTKISFDQNNTLKPLFSTSGKKVTGFLGQYDGREEDIYKCQSERGIFVFIISGAFEVQNRLLEKGDALSLLNVEDVEFEALSNGAVILLMEVGMG